MPLSGSETKIQLGTSVKVMAFYGQVVLCFLTSSRAYAFRLGGSECGLSVGEGGWILAGGGGGNARGDRLATGDSLRGGSGELARMKLVM